MTIPEFTAEASLHRTRGHYRITGGLASVVQSRLLPQQIVPPGLRCWLDYLACNASCASWPIWRRAVCYSYCFNFYTKCLAPIR